MPLSQGITDAIYAAYNTEQPIDAQVRGAFKLLSYGYLDNARDALKRLMAKDPFDERVLRLQRSCRRARIYHQDPSANLNGVQTVTIDGLAEPIKVRPPTDVVIARAGTVKQALIAFGGAAELFWLPREFLELTNCHLVILRDPRRHFHMAGIEGLGETYEECVQGLRHLVSDLAATKVFMAGSSSGGYAALRYALDLGGVRAVLAISPVTGGDFVAGTEQHPGLRAVMRAAPEMMVDTLPLYQQHSDPPKVIVAWGDQHATDNEQAVRMGVVPNVTLEPLRGVSHHPIPVHLVVRPEFDLVKRLLAI